ncbi:PKD-like family lipoprotein [Chitinophaga horti]|uniref:PKD-like family lipoprotein n=1 Tax=Chitinophaga horti TaxID=2920382 RepID=A0ABY6IUY0_9BACT|nr:PKD-like family lipoprotein [Chitinophaga horti]UYQ91170.1 PKD-like family lipoprotein [Chitinophaga horti]
MKKIYIIAACLLVILAGACSKDDSSGITNPLPAVEVDGLEEAYSLYTRRDTLRINPTVADESLYDFYWTVYTTGFVQGTGQVPKPDTLARTKNIEYAVVMDPGNYYLIFNVKHKASGVVKMINIPLTVATLTMKGWYLLKDDGAHTDFDFIHPEGRINNWIAFFNEGRKMSGKAVKAVFIPGYKTGLSSTNLFSTLMVLSENDLLVCRVDNGKVVNSFDDIFFSKPPVRKLQNALVSMSGSNIGLINNNLAYAMTKGALFADLPPTYRVSGVAGVAAMDIGFDITSKSVICYNFANFAALGSNGGDLKNMGADMTWIGGYAGVRSAAMALFRKPDGSGILAKLNAQYGYLAGFQSPLVPNKQNLSSEHGLMNASTIGGNYDADYVYYAIGNSIYRTDIATISETLQVSVPAGETITCIQHVKYPQPVSATVPPTVDYLAIASYANGHYKVWLHKVNSTGTIQPVTAPSFEGDGRVTNITYMEQGLGSRTF